MTEAISISINNLVLFDCDDTEIDDTEIVRLIFSDKDLLSKPDYEEGEFYKKYTYKTSVRRAKERLDVMQFGEAYFKEVFNTNIYNAIDYTDYLLHLGVNSSDHYEVFKEKVENNEVTFEKWQSALANIINYELINGNIKSWENETDKGLSINSECDKLIYYSFKEPLQENYYGLFSWKIHEAFVIRQILESCKETDEIEFNIYLELADVAPNEYDYFDGTDIINDLLMKGIPGFERTIVVVEGIRDQEILQYAMEKLFPHLSELFYFMEFQDEEGLKREGGTSFIIKNIKAFLFARIRRNFIAIFDNDAEGYSAKCQLLNYRKSWPENFRILLYPKIEQFNAYPTYAPDDSILTIDINKRACSIELYLPDSFIKSESKNNPIESKYYPIEWEARKKIKTEDGQDKYFYQGVISNKGVIGKKFDDFLKSEKKNKKVFVEEEWGRMKMLLESIVFAFSEKSR